MSLLATSPPPTSLTNPIRVDLDWICVALELDRASDTVAKLHELPAGVHVDLFEFKIVRDVDVSDIIQLQRYLETNGNTPDSPRIAGATRATIRVDRWSESRDERGDERFARRVERILRALIDLNNVTTLKLCAAAWYSVAPIIRPDACKLSKLVLPTRTTPDMLAHPLMRIPTGISILCYSGVKIPVTGATFNPRLTSLRTTCELEITTQGGSADMWRAFGTWYPSIHMIRGPHTHNRDNLEDACVAFRALERGMAFKPCLPKWELEEMRNDPVGVPPRRWYSTTQTPHDPSLRLRPSIKLFSDYVYPSALTPKMAEGLRSALTARFPWKVDDNMHVWTSWRVRCLIELSIRYPEYPEPYDIITDDTQDVIIGGNVVDFIFNYGVARLGHDPDGDVARVLGLLSWAEVITIADVRFLGAVVSGSMASGRLRRWMIREGNSGRLERNVQEYKLALSKKRVSE
jgi:hypothetical protein